MQPLVVVVVVVVWVGGSGTFLSFYSLVVVSGLGEVLYFHERTSMV